MSPNVVVVGGGAAGLLAAISAAEHGADVVLLERNRRLGTKMLMSGGGRCNITNTGDVEHLVQSFPGNGRFLYSAFRTFGSRDILDLLAEEGVLTREEDRGRAFPASGKAQDVVDALEKRALTRGVEIRFETRVTELKSRPGGNGFAIVTEDGTTIEADRIVLATGGVTYPGSGSTGDGYLWAEAFGHKIVKAKPAMVALETEEDWPERVSGVTLRSVQVLVRAGKATVAKYSENVLFTHYGLSGPAILNVSHAAVEALENQADPVTIAIKSDPDFNADDWEGRLQMALREHPRQLMKSLVARWWPASLSEVLLEVHGVPPDVMANQVTKAHRRQTAELLHEFVLTVAKPRPLETAMVTAGGIDTAEVNPRTMESLKVPGLFFAGEILDVDGISGGYNLQGAYSTGYLAGKAAAKAE